MKEIRRFEELMNAKGNISLKDAGVNSTLYWAYRISKEESENDLIDFNEVIWDYDIKEIADSMRAEGIKEFTISSAFSSLIETLAEFEKKLMSLFPNITCVSKSREIGSFIML